MTTHFINQPLLKTGRACGFCMFPDNDIVSVDEQSSIYRSHAVMPDQTHSLNVAVATGPGELFPDTDALVTFVPGLAIGVKTADCVPILIYAPDIEGVAAVHAGWKGSLGGIVNNTLDLLKNYGADLSELIVAFGPSISMAKYEVGQDLADKFIEAGFGNCVFYPDGENGRPHIDLQGVNKERLLSRGVKLQNIHLHDGCTYGSVNPDGSYIYRSHRRSGGSPTRNLTAIYLLDNADE